MKYSTYSCYASIEPHHHSLFFFIFSFIHLNFSSPYSQKKIFFSLSIHTYTYISSNLSPFFLSLHLPTTLYLLLHFLLLSFVLIFLLPILFSINSISFFQFNPYFSYKKLWVLFLSLSLSRFLLFLITLIKVDFFFSFLICVLVLCVCVFYFILFFIFRKSFLSLL